MNVHPKEIIRAFTRGRVELARGPVKTTGPDVSLT